MVLGEKCVFICDFSLNLGHDGLLGTTLHNDDEFARIDLFMLSMFRSNWIY
jgi:hypothetical protein